MDNDSGEIDLSKYQTKSLTPVDQYVCTLSDELRSAAMRDFGETEELRQTSIREMREWIMDNERIIKCRMDSVFLLRFLRFRKYDVPKAKESLERYLLFREGKYGSDWLSNLDLDKPNIADLIDKGLLVTLSKRDSFGRLTLLVRLAVTDPSIPSIGEEGLTLATTVVETLLDNEENQIRGFNYILDFSNIKLRHYFIFSFPTWFKIAKNVEKTCAARHKHFQAVNLHPTLRYVGKIVLRHMPEKLRKRVFFCASYEEVEIVTKADLPVECDGETAIDTLIDPWRKTLESKKEFFLNCSNMRVDHNAYPKNVLKCDVSTLNTSLDVLCARRNLTRRSSSIEVD